jgi:hypothetical protein
MSEDKEQKDLSVGAVIVLILCGIMVWAIFVGFTVNIIHNAWHNPIF